MNFQVDLNAMALEEAAELSRQEELKRRKKALQNERFKRVLDEMKGGTSLENIMCGLIFI